MGRVFGREVTRLSEKCPRDEGGGRSRKNAREPLCQNVWSLIEPVSARSTVAPVPSADARQADARAAAPQSYTGAGKSQRSSCLPGPFPPGKSAARNEATAQCSRQSSTNSHGAYFLNRLNGLFRDSPSIWISSDFRNIMRWEVHGFLHRQSWESMGYLGHDLCHPSRTYRSDNDVHGSNGILSRRYTGMQGSIQADLAEGFWICQSCHPNGPWLDFGEDSENTERLQRPIPPTNCAGTQTRASKGTGWMWRNLASIPSNATEGFRSSNPTHSESHPGGTIVSLSIFAMISPELSEIWRAIRSAMSVFGSLSKTDLPGTRLTADSSHSAVPSTEPTS